MLSSLANQFTFAMSGFFGLIGSVYPSSISLSMPQSMRHSLLVWPPLNKVDLFTLELCSSREYLEGSSSIERIRVSVVIPMPWVTCRRIGSDCRGSGRRSELLQCARCRTQAYCSKEHQKADWKSTLCIPFFFLCYTDCAWGIPHPI